MGTNFYWTEKEPCECCGRAFDDRHIGKSSAGWCFTLRVYPEDGINTLDDWEKLWESGVITDEYDTVVPVSAMKARIRNRPLTALRHPIDSHCIGHGPGTWDYIDGEFS